MIRIIKMGFLIRSADPIYFGNKKIKLDLNNEFYLQRALIGKTKSFNNKNDSMYANKIEQDNNLSDLFGINTNLSTKFYGFDLNSELALNSLDINKFNNILTSKNTLEKILYEEKKENSSKATKLTLFSNYRENIWNGSLGEKEILSASGLRIGKKNDWIS